MVFPAVAAGAAKLLAMPGVKEAALNGATKIATNVYGRVMGAQSAELQPEASVDIASIVSDLPTREEMVASFALLQAELDRRNRRTTALVGGVLVLQVVLIGLLLLQA